MLKSGIPRFQGYNCKTAYTLKGVSNVSIKKIIIHKRYPLLKKNNNK